MSRIEPQLNITADPWPQDMTFKEFCEHCAMYGFTSVGMSEDEYEELWGFTTSDKYGIVCDLNGGCDWNTTFFAQMGVSPPLILPSTQAEIQEFAR